MKTIYDIIIIGGGTAGMTAAIYGYRSGKDILIIEKSFFGGQIISTSEVENFPGFSSIKGYSFASELHQQISAADISQAYDEVTSVRPGDGLWTVSCRKSSYSGRTVIIAVGTKNRKLGIDGEERYTGHGLSYCATCDGAFYKNQSVAVVGGGSNALEEALYLSLLCKTVYLIHRRDKFSGEHELQRRISETENIKALFNTEVTGLHGNDRLEKLELSAANAAVSGAENRDEKSTETLNISGLFVAIGQIPQNEIFSQMVEIDSNGYIIAGEDCRTSAYGIFAAGDCRTKDLRQLVTAASDGAVAATEAIRLINKDL